MCAYLHKHFVNTLTDTHILSIYDTVVSQTKREAPIATKSSQEII